MYDNHICFRSLNSIMSGNIVRKPNYKVYKQMSLQEGCQCNEQLLAELIEVISELSSNCYQSPSLYDDTQNIGAHVRHTIEFYQCFFSGLDTRYIDYDSRKRNLDYEKNISSALNELLTLKKQMAELKKSTDNFNIKLNSCIDTTGIRIEIESSVLRELLFLENHTTHHMAIINMLMQQSGYVSPQNFGVAKSTIIHREQLKASENDKATID